MESVDRIVDPGAVARRRLFLFVAGDEGQRGCGLVRQLLRHFLLGRNFESTTITTITKTIGDNNTLRSVRKLKWSVWAVCFLEIVISQYGWHSRRYGPKAEAILDLPICSVVPEPTSPPRDGPKEDFLSLHNLTIHTSIIAIWIMTPCRLAARCQCFEGIFYRYFQD